MCYTMWIQHTLYPITINSGNQFKINVIISLTTLRLPLQRKANRIEIIIELMLSYRTELTHIPDPGHILPTNIIYTAINGNLAGFIYLSTYICTYASMLGNYRGMFRKLTKLTNPMDLLDQ